MKAWRAVSIEIEDQEGQEGEEEEDYDEYDGEEEEEEEEDDEEEDTGEDIDMEECEADVVSDLDNDLLDGEIDEHDPDVIDNDDNPSSEELLTASADKKKNKVSRSEGALLAGDSDNDSFVSASSKATSHGDSIVPPDPPASAPPYINERGCTLRTSYRGKHSDKLMLLQMDRHVDSPSPRRFEGTQPDVEQADELFERAKQYIEMCPEYSETNIPVLETRFRGSSRSSSRSPTKSASPFKNISVRTTGTTSSQEAESQWTEASDATYESMPSPPMANADECCEEELPSTTSEHNDDGNETDTADVAEEAEEDEPGEDVEEEENHYQIKQNIATSICLVAPNRSGYTPSECSSEEVSSSDPLSLEGVLEQAAIEEPQPNDHDQSAHWVRSYSSTISPIGAVVDENVDQVVFDNEQPVDEFQSSANEREPSPTLEAEPESDFNFDITLDNFVLSSPPPGRSSTETSKSPSIQGITQGVDDIHFADDDMNNSTVTIMLQPEPKPIVPTNVSPLSVRAVSPPRVFTFSPERPTSPSPTDTNRERQSMSPTRVEQPAARCSRSATRKSREKRKRNKTLAGAESLFNKAAELLQRPFNSNKKTSRSESPADKNKGKRKTQSTDSTATDDSVGSGPDQVHVTTYEPANIGSETEENADDLPNKRGQLGRNLSEESRGERRASYRSAIDICAIPAESVPRDQVVNADIATEFDGACCA